LAFEKSLNTFSGEHCELLSLLLYLCNLLFLGDFSLFKLINEREVIGLAWIEAEICSLH
jgi:hypothetical protein